VSSSARSSGWGLVSARIGANFLALRGVYLSVMPFRTPACMRRTIVFLLALAVPGHASQCHLPSPCEIMGDSSVVAFRGLLLYGGSRNPEDCEQRAYYWVLEWFVGGDEGPWLVPVEDCGLSWPGRTMIVYARRTKDGKLVTPKCGWPASQSANERDEDLAYLRQFKAGDASTFVRGYAMTDGPYGRAHDATVTLTNERRRYVAKSAADGQFEFTNVVPGNYEVRVIQPKYQQVEPFGPSQVVVSVAGSCAYADVYLHLTKGGHSP